MESDQERNAQSENYEELDFEMDYGEDGPYSQSEGSRKIEEDDKGDEFSLLGSADDEEQKRKYMEYLSLIKEIGCQNQVIADLKAQIVEMCAKPCKTKCEIKDIRRMQQCMEQENLKLHCLMTKAINLQNFGSHRMYQEIPIETTFDEDNLIPYVGCIPPQSSNWKGQSSENEKSCTGHEAKEKEDKQFKCLCHAMGKMKVCCPEDKKLIQEIAAALLCSHNKRQPRDPCSQHKQQKQSHGGVRKCKSLHQHQHQQPAPDCMAMGADSLDKLKQKIACMQSSVNKLKQEICKREQREKEPPCEEEPDPMILCGRKRNTKTDQLEKLKDNYLHLLSEYGKKDCQLKELEKRLKGFCGGCGGGNGKADDANDAELQLLRGRVNEMKEEQTEFKCLMKEQSQQLEDYRNKYLAAQQKVEEQNVIVDKLNMNNKRIEKQINTEVKEIRAKFQEKLNELLHFPKLLENEQLKLAAVCKEKDDLQSKLLLVCKELKACKSTDSPKENNDCRPQLAKCQMELSQAQTKIEELEKQRDMFCDQLKTTQDDLDMLRSESAKIIARTKERSEMIKQQLQEQIDRLEKELAQCRATTCLSVNDREAVIREMQGQLNTLSYSFDAAQKQIKTLRNHIAYVSNENCFPVKC